MATRKRKEALVTKESLNALLLNPKLRVATIGRALTILYREQTPREQTQKATFEHNGVGFTGSDATIGSRCAEHFIRTGDLQGWMVDLWMTRNSKGHTRIAKYHAQLNKVAIAKAATRRAVDETPS